MHELIRPVAETYAFNSRIVSLATADLTNEHAVTRMKGGRGSSISYLIGHISSSRCGLLKMLGVSADNPFAELFGAGVGSSDGSDYPPIRELADRWEELAGDFRRALEDLAKDRLLAEPPISYPTPDSTVRGALAFICWHECYHVGQIGLMRTELGYDSLRQRLYSSTTTNS
jgi:uncharacterized damage-inducible protein DinB